MTRFIDINNQGKNLLVAVIGNDYNKVKEILEGRYNFEYFDVIALQIAITLRYTRLSSILTAYLNYKFLSGSEELADFERVK
jgi:hypothetical protein